jgi:CDP-glycerol glycerophosphotransferase (TagB/SpsB family)
MGALARWTDALARRGDVAIIFRPRPAVDADDLRRFLRDDCGLPDLAFRFIKEQTAREWVLASDVVISSYSTVLIEAAIARKIIRKVEPMPLPPQLQYDWCDLVSSAVTQDDFLEATSPGAHDGGSERLRAWAEERFFSLGDPVPRLIQTMAREIKSAYVDYAPSPNGPYAQKMPGWLAAIDRFLKPRTRDALYNKYVPGYTHKVKGHEKDFFDAQDVNRRTLRWRAVIAGSTI